MEVPAPESPGDHPVSVYLEGPHGEAFYAFRIVVK
jgi:hypothetical protein